MASETTRAALLAAAEHLNGCAERDERRGVPSCRNADLTPDNWCDGCVIAGLLDAIAQHEEAGAQAPTQAQVEAEAHKPPHVHCCCEPSNHAGAPNFGVYCHHTRTWVDGAAQQDDYTCPRCKTRITVNVDEWRSVAAQEPKTCATCHCGPNEACQRCAEV